MSDFDVKLALTQRYCTFAALGR